MPANKKTDVVTTITLATDITDLEALGTEMQDWYDDKSESYQNSEKGTTYQEGADTLSSLTLPDVPEIIAGISITYQTEQNDKNPPAMRRDNVVAALDAVIKAAEKWLENKDAKPKPEADTEADTEAETPAETDDGAEMDDAVQNFIDDLQTIIDDASNVEFPKSFN
jgi:hypothetical protein